MAMTNIREYSIPSGEEDYPIRISYYQAAKNQGKPLLIVCHGFKGFKDWGPFPLMASFLASAGFPVLMFNFSLNGLTETSPKEIADTDAFARNSIRRELEDLQRVITHAEATYHPLSLGLIGHSRGGGIALLGAAHHTSVKGVTCLAPVHDFANRYPEEVLAQWEKEGIIHVINGRNGMNLPVLWSTAEDYRNHKALLDLPSLIPDLAIPILVFHGYGDETLPVVHAETLASWNPRIDLRLMDTGHTFGGKHPWNEQVLPPALLRAVQEMTVFFDQI
jgi:uncharacterized protein